MLLCVVGSCCAKFETGKTFSPVQTDATLEELLHPFARSLGTDRIKAMSRSFTEGKKSRSSLLILQNRKRRTFHFKDDNGK